MAATSLAFLILFLGGLGLCVVRGPVWGLYTYVAVFYLHPPSRWWGAFLPDLRWSLVAAAVTFLCVVFRKRSESLRPPFFAHGIAWIFLLYVLWIWIQTPFAVSDTQIEGAVLFTKYFVLMYMIYVIVDSSDRVRDFLLLHVAGCFYLAWLAYTSVGGGRLEGVGGPGIDDSNTMSMQFATGIIAGSVLLMTERGWRFWLPAVSMPFLVNGLMQGSSRGAFLGLVAGGLCLFWLKPRAYRKQFLAFGVLGLLLFAYLANQMFLERMGTLTAVTSDEAELDFSAASRFVIMRAQWQMFLDHPLGAGHEGTAQLSPAYLAPEYLTRGADGTLARSSHNTFMSVLVDQGVPGIMLLAMLLVWVWRSIGAVTKRSGTVPRVWGYGAAISAALAVAAVAGQFSPYLKAEVQYWLLGLLLCMKFLGDRQSVLEQSARSSGRLDSMSSRAASGQAAWAGKADRSVAVHPKAGVSAAASPRRSGGARE
jgi:hypothetical protein